MGNNPRTETTEDCQICLLGGALYLKIILKKKQVLAPSPHRARAAPALHLPETQQRTIGSDVVLETCDWHVPAFFLFRIPLFLTDCQLFNPIVPASSLIFVRPPNIVHSLLNPSFFHDQLPQHIEEFVCPLFIGLPSQQSLDWSQAHSVTLMFGCRFLSNSPS